MDHQKSCEAASATARLKYQPLGGFNTLKSQVWSEGFGTVDYDVEGRGFLKRHHKETLKRVWQSLFKRQSEVLRSLEGRISRWSTKGLKARQKKGRLNQQLEIGREAYEAALGRRVGREESDDGC